MIHPFFKDYSLTFNGLSWYLAVTFFLYFISYYLIKLVDKNKINSTYNIVVLLLVTTIINICNRYLGTLYIYCNPFYHVLDFLLGMYIAKAYMKDTNKLKNANLIELLLVVVFILQYGLSFIVGDDPSYYSILFTIALYVFAKGEGIISKLLCNKYLVVIAKYSFDFYMIHELMLRIFRKVFNNLMLWYPIRCIIIAIPALICSILFVLVYKKLTSIKT